MHTYTPTHIVTHFAQQFTQKTFNAYLHAKLLWVHCAVPIPVRRLVVIKSSTNQIYKQSFATHTHTHHIKTKQLKYNTVVSVYSTKLPFCYCQISTSTRFKPLQQLSENAQPYTDSHIRIHTRAFTHIYISQQAFANSEIRKL